MTCGCQNLSSNLVWRTLSLPFTWPTLLSWHWATPSVVVPNNKSNDDDSLAGPTSKLGGDGDHQVNHWQNYFCHQMMPLIWLTFCIKYWSTWSKWIIVVIVGRGKAWDWRELILWVGFCLLIHLVQNKYIQMQCSSQERKWHAVNVSECCKLKKIGGWMRWDCSSKPFKDLMNNRLHCFMSFATLEGGYSGSMEDWLIGCIHGFWGQKLLLVPKTT